MSVKNCNLILDVQDGTNGNNIITIDYNDFLDYSDDCDLDIITKLTVGEYKLFNTLRKCLRYAQHDIFIKLGYKN